MLNLKMDLMNSPYPWKGSNRITDNEEKDDALNLHKGTYTMFSCEFEVLIYKKEGLKMECYNLLRNFQHDNAVPLLDFFIEKKKYGCIVIPKLHSTFQYWFENTGKSLLFDTMDHMTSKLYDMIMEFCDLIESLLAQGLVLEHFDMDNIFVNVLGGVPTLQVLVTEVRKVKVVGAVDRKLSWDCAVEFLSWCEKQCNIRRDALTTDFCTFLGKSNCDMAKLRKYPHSWDDSMKGEYLMSLVASDHGRMRYLLKDSGLTWPFLELPRIFDNLPYLLQDILNWDERNGRLHNTLDFFSYVILLRNLYKHYSGLPKELQDIFVNRGAIIKQIEIWTHGFWRRIYERVGWP